MAGRWPVLAAGIHCRRLKSSIALDLLALTARACDISTISLPPGAEVGALTYVIVTSLMTRPRNCDDEWGESIISLL